MDQPGLGPTDVLRHLERIQDQVGVELVVDRPAHDVAVEDVDDDTEVEPAFVRAVLGDIGDPHAIGRVVRERACDVIVVQLVEVTAPAASRVRRWTPWRPARRVKRATRCLETRCSNSSSSSVCTRRAPYVARLSSWMPLMTSLSAALATSRLEAGRLRQA
jgi:hypothetical protein